MRTEYRKCFHTLYDEKNIYICKYIIFKLITFINNSDLCRFSRVTACAYKDNDDFCNIRRLTICLSPPRFSLSLSLYIYIYIYTCVCVCVCEYVRGLAEKVHRLTYILSWNVTKRGLFFNTDYLQSTHFFHQCCSAWIPLVKLFNSRCDVIPWNFQLSLHPKISGLPKNPIYLIFLWDQLSPPIPHNTANFLAKTLSPFLIIISDALINNSASLFNKIININTKNKFLVCVDIKSLHTNIPVDKCIKRQENHLKKTL